MKENDVNSIHVYKLFMNKSHNAICRSINLNSTRILSEAANRNLFGMRKRICAFNPRSFLNIKRISESEKLYLDEIEHETQPFSKLAKFMKKQYSIISKSFIEQKIEIQPFDFDDQKAVAGNVMMFIVSPNDSSKAQTIVKKFSILAHRFGYNYVCHDIDDMYSNDSYEIQIQLEATYFPGNVKIGDILWHVTTKNAARKIVDQKRGLVPRTQSERGFSYSPRVFCFKVLNHELMRSYAQNSWKSNKKFVMSDDYQLSAIKSEWIRLVKKEYGALFDTREFVILKIDTTRLKNVFYRDNTFEVDDWFVAVYTEDCIPHDAIEKADEFIA